MSDNTNLPATTNEVVVAEKRQAWANLGEKTHNLALELLNESEGIKKELVMPSDITQINSTEAALKIAKQKTNQLVEKRKSVTNLVNTAFSKLMIYEKDLAETYIPGIEKKLIELKKEKKIADDLEQAKTDETKRLKEEAIKYINDYDLLFKTEINKKVSGAFEHALGAGNITNEGLPEFIVTVKAMFKPIQFVVPMIKPVLKNVNHDEFLVIWEEVKAQIKEPVYYVGAETSLFELEISKKFEFYEVALLNKDGALAQAKGMEAKTDEALKKENASANVSATLQSMATTATVKKEETKALKQKFDLDMSSDKSNALLIMAAFGANIDKTEQYVKADWFNLSIKQMGAALVAIKNGDNKAEFTGIKFKIVDKL